MSAPPDPPYTRAFLIKYRQEFIKQQEAEALKNFVTSVTNSVLAAAKQGLGSFTVKTIPVSAQFQQAMGALRENFPDITIRLINLPTEQKKVSVPAIYITWV